MELSASAIASREGELESEERVEDDAPLVSMARDLNLNFGLGTSCARRRFS